MRQNNWSVEDKVAEITAMEQTKDKRMKRHLGQWETDRGLISNISKQLISLNVKKQPDQEMGRKCEKTLFQREIQEINRQIKIF